MDSLEHIYNSALLNSGFDKQTNHFIFNKAGILYHIPPEIGKGFYWFYSYQNLYILKIHDFYLYADAEMAFNYSDCLNICYYDSISAIEVDSNQKMESGYVKFHYGNKKTVNVKIFRDVPIRSIEIEITPAGIQKYIKGAESSLSCKDKAEIFPDMADLLLRIPHFQGEGLAASLFYESKIKEALSLVLIKETATGKASRTASSDEKSLIMAIEMIEQNLDTDLTIEKMCKVSCMGKTKFTSLFKEKYDMTPTDYIKKRRLKRAKTLLLKSDKTIQEIASEVGFKNPGRFAHCFKEHFGVYPSEFRLSS